MTDITTQDELREQIGILIAKHLDVPIVVMITKEAQVEVDDFMKLIKAYKDNAVTEAIKAFRREQNKKRKVAKLAQEKTKHYVALPTQSYDSAMADSGNEAERC